MKFSEAILHFFANKPKEPSFMVAIYPDEETIKKINEFKKSISKKGGEEIKNEEMHITLRWWKQKEFDDIEKLKNRLSGDVYFSRDCTKGKAKNLKLLGKEEKDKALVIEIESSAIAELQEKIDRGLQKLGVPPSDFKEFICHLSLFYGFSEELPKEKPDFDIGVRVIKLVDNDDKVHWSYSGD